MVNNLTRIVLDTEGLKQELDSKLDDSPAINYQARLGDSWKTVFLVSQDLVAQKEEHENHLEVILREGVTPRISCGQLLLKTNQPEVWGVRMPSWLGGKRIDVPIPFRRRVYYCTNLNYLVSVYKGDKLLYERTV